MDYIAFPILLAFLTAISQATYLHISPSGSTLVAGTDVSLSCRDSKYTQRYTLTINGHTLSESSSHTLKVNPTHSGSWSCCGYRDRSWESCHYCGCGNYQCDLGHSTSCCSRQHATDTSCSSTMHISIPANRPSLNVHNREPLERDRTSFSCDGASYGVSSYVFKHGSTVVQSGSSKTYAFDAVLGQHTGQYTCETTFTSTFGSTTAGPSNVATVHVHPKPPTITSTSGNSTFYEGGHMMLHCHTSSKGSSIIFTFLHNGNAVQSGNLNAFVVYSFKPADSGSYTCQVKIGGIDSPLSKSHDVTVLPTHVPLDVSSRDPTDGDRLSLTCGTSAYKATSYVFRQDGITVHTGSTRTMSILVGSNKGHSGLYTCSMIFTSPTTNVSSDSSSPVKVNVHPKTPTLSSMSVNVTSFASGDALTLLCRTNSLGYPTYTFLKDGNVVQANNFMNTFVVHSLTPMDSGSYTCKATIGGVSSSASSPQDFSVSLIPTTTVRTALVFNCETGPNALEFYTYPFDPTKYIHCDKDGFAYLETCSAGETWSQVIQKCQLSANLDVVG